MKRFLSALLAIAFVFSFSTVAQASDSSIINTEGLAPNVSATDTPALEVVNLDPETAAIAFAAETYLLAAAENMWLYESNDLTIGTVTSYLTANATNTAVLFDMETMGLCEENVERYEHGISFIENKTKYFKNMRQSQNIIRNDFNIDYTVLDLTLDENTAQLIMYEYISFRYPDFPDVLSEVANTYTVDLVKLNNSWLIADVTSENDWFDNTYKEIGFNADNPEESFQLASLENTEISDILAEYENINFVEAAPSETATTSSTSILRNYNQANAAAYAYTYATSTYNNVGTQSDTQAADAENYWNENFEKFSGFDCMNFASQCMWAGFNGSNEVDKIYDSETGTHASPMDSSGTYQWCGTTRGGGYVSDTLYWRSCYYFRAYIENEASSSLPDFYATYNSISGTENFSSVVSSASSLIGAVLHVNNSGTSGHAIVVTDANGLERNQVLFTAHTSDRKGVKVGDYWSSGLIYVIIPQQIRIYNPEAVVITATLQRPVPVGTTLSLTSNANTTCNSMTMYIYKGSSHISTNISYNQSYVTRNHTFSSAGLYTITTTATTSTGPVTYVYTIRVY